MLNDDRADPFLQQDQLTRELNTHTARGDPLAFLFRKIGYIHNLEKMQMIKFRLLALVLAVALVGNSFSPPIAKASPDTETELVNEKHASSADHTSSTSPSSPSTSTHPGSKLAPSKRDVIIALMLLLGGSSGKESTFPVQGLSQP